MNRAEVTYAKPYRVQIDLRFMSTLPVYHQQIMNVSSPNSPRGFHRRLSGVT